MKKRFKKTLLITALCFSPSIVLATDAPITFFPNTLSTTPVPTDKIINLVKEKMPLSAVNYHAVKIQIVYNSQKKPDYLLVYLMAAKTYSFTVTKIKINDQYQAQSITPDYRLQPEDYLQQPSAQTTRQEDVHCPSNTVEFISATPVPEYPTAKAAIVSTALEAMLYGYQSRTLLNNQATVKTYLDWLSCPQLKGFYTVGHGSPYGIMLADGTLTSDMISQQLKNKLTDHTVVLFNSCNVFNEPLKPALIDDAKAQRYAGGITTLWIGPSELASRCFWDAAFKQESMTPLMAYCNQKYDPTDIFGIGGQGEDNLRFPGRFF